MHLKKRISLKFDYTKTALCEELASPIISSDSQRQGPAPPSPVLTSVGNMMLTTQ